MEQRLDCEIVQDLLPGYIEHLTSEGTNMNVKKHLDGCPKCREIHQQMTQEIEVAPVTEAKEVKTFLTRTKLRYGMMGLGVLCAIGIIVCLIVNLALERTITWAVIPVAGILYGYLGIHVFAVSKKHRFLSGLLVYSVLLIPLLWVFDAGMHYLMGEKERWFWSAALPIALIWLAFVWASVFTKLIFKWNVLYCFGILCFLAIPGNYFTNWLAEGYISFESGMLNFIINSVCSVVGGFTFLAGGRYWDAHKKNRV
jgi:hypothetical protein